MTPPTRHWHSYGDAPPPTAAEALDEPLRAFPSWLRDCPGRAYGQCNDAAGRGLTRPQTALACMTERAVGFAA